MGAVYEATQLSLNRVVALKLLAPNLSDDPGFRARFEREGQVQAALDHEHIVTVYEAGQSEYGLFLAMRLIAGPTLKHLILDGELDPRRSVRLLAQVAYALDAAHEAGLIHRDIKPQNILIGKGDHAYLADFGLIKAPGRGAAHRDRPVHRHDRLRRARADPGRPRHAGQRLLRACRRPVRVPDRRGPVPQAVRGRHAARPRDVAPADRQRAPPRPAPGARRRDRPGDGQGPVVTARRSRPS